MNENKRNFSLLLAFGIWILIIGCGKASGNNQDNNDEKDETTYDFPHTMAVSVPNPVIPESMELWDEEISFDRYDMYERLDRELTANAYTHGSTLLNIKRANRYFPVIAPILLKNGIPLDMLYLAVIESNLDERALSPAKAAGIWQFMPATARQYGLEVNESIDERYNLEKATEAACRYFKDAYAKYGNWNSVAASYNAGMGKISNEMAIQKTDDVFDLYLITETNRYVFRIMALKLIMENPKEFGFSLQADQLYAPMEYDIIEVKNPIDDLVSWAKKHGVTYMHLREANPWLRSLSLPTKTGKTYVIKIPKTESLYRSKQEKSIYNPSWIAN